MDSTFQSSDSKSHAWSWRNGQLPLVVILVLLLLSSYYLATESAERLPSKLGDLTLTEERAGDDAQQLIDRLHGKSVTPMENAIGAYDGITGKAMLYLSIYTGPEEAASAEKMMSDRIRVGNSVFLEYEELMIANHPVSFCRGMGQVHYFFSSGSTVYWLAVDESAAATTIAGLVSHAGLSSYSW